VSEGAIRIGIEDGGIAVITLDRPGKRNALSIAVRERISDTLEAWQEDEEVRVVVITGVPPAFCAGFDLDEFARAELSAEIRRSSSRYHHAVWGFPKPTLAAVNGPALAGGFDLALLCDLRLASTEAAFSHPEIKFGAPPLFTPLRWIVGDGLARDLCLTGRKLDAEAAERFGLVSAVTEPDRLLEQAIATAHRIAEAPQVALEATKRYLTASTGLGFEDSFLLEHDEVFDRFLSGSTGPRSKQD
jgi:enoyl-CoA hydratase